MTRRTQGLGLLGVVALLLWAAAVGVLHPWSDDDPAGAWVVPSSADGQPATVRAWHPWSATTAAGVTTTCVSSKDAVALPPLTTP